MALSQLNISWQKQNNKLWLKINNLSCFIDKIKN